jgi:hypothetical protein
LDYLPAMCNPQGSSLKKVHASQGGQYLRSDTYLKDIMGRLSPKPDKSIIYNNTVKS